MAIRAADMPSADELMLRIYAAMAQRERELMSARTRAALAAAKARGMVLGGDRGWRPVQRPDAGSSQSGTSGYRPTDRAPAGAGGGAAAGRGPHQPSGSGTGADRAGRGDTPGRHAVDAHPGGTGAVRRNGGTWFARGDPPSGVPVAFPHFGRERRLLDVSSACNPELLRIAPCISN